MRLAALFAVGLAGAAVAGDPPPRRELVVRAASSLQGVFTDLKATFEASHPGVMVTLSFAGSQVHRTQVEHGAVADVFASADAPQLKALQDAGLCRAPTEFARNDLVLVVPRDAPGALASFEELARARRVVVGVPESPIGAYTVKMLDRADKARPGFRKTVEARIASRELNVRQVLVKVALGEADVGVVYRTDALASPERVSMVEVPPAFNESTEYLASVLTRAPQPKLAKEFIALLTGAEGRRALEARGFIVGAQPAAPSTGAPPADTPHDGGRTKRP